MSTLKLPKTKYLDAYASLVSQATTTEQKDVVDYSKVGNVLRGMREKAGLSLREMASRIGRTSPFLSDCERGNRRLNAVDAAKYLEACEK